MNGKDSHQKLSWNPELFWTMVGAHKDRHILCAYEQVDQHSLHILLHRAHSWILSLSLAFLFRLSRNYAGVDIEVADPVDETLVEDLPVLPEEFVVCTSILPRRPVDERHGKHVNGASSHQRPEVPRSAGVGKDDKDDESC